MKLEQIKAHPLYPFSGFRTDDLQFLMLELYWAELFRGSVPDIAVGDWQPEWPADPEDGNPILHIANRHITPPRMLRVIQKHNLGQLPELNLRTFDLTYYRDDAYVPFAPGLTRGGLDEDMVTPIDELVIFSDVCEQCELLFKRYVQLWCVDRTSAQNMEKQIAAFWARVEASLVQLRP